MKCSCSGDTQVAETRIIEGIIRRRRKCTQCAYTFWTKEIFDREPEVRGRPADPTKKIFTKPEAAAIKKKKVDARRKSEDIKEQKKLRVPSYFIEEEDY